MNKGIPLIVTAAFAVAVTGYHVSAQGVTSRAAAGEVGRYQLVRASESHIFLIDTATGQCWGRTLDGDWHDKGNPIQTRGQQTKVSAPTLNLPETAVEMIVVQREAQAIPGSDGSVRIRLGDITDGQVLMSVVNAADDDLLRRTSVSQGDKVEFSVGKKRYTVHIKVLRNILMGDDFAKVTVAEFSEENTPKKQPSPDAEK